MADSAPHVLGELSSYLDQQLAKNDRQRIETHLKACESCHRHYEELRALRQMLQGSPTFKPPESFYQGVLRRIEGKDTAPLGFSWGIPAKTLATACVAMLVVWVAHEHRKGETPSQVLNERKADLKERQSKAAEAQLKSEVRPMKSALPDQIKIMKNKTVSTTPVAAGKVAPAREGSLDQAESDRFRRPIANAPVAQPLAKRSDIVYQARDITGPASQNSFAESEKTLSKGRKEPVSALPDGVRGAGMGASAAIGGTVAAPPPVLPEWKGNYCGIDKRTVVIRTQEEWEKLWKDHHSNTTPTPPLPQVDFNTHMVVGIYTGPKPSEGYSIEILETRTTPDALVVVYRETSPPPGSVQGTVITHPHHLRVISKTNLPVQFGQPP